METLLIVGDGPVSEVLGPMAELLGWKPRSVATLDDTLAALPGSTAVVVLSHHEGVDAPALAAALESDVAYIGAMGSRRTQTRRREWLDENGFSEADQTRIHGPAGIDIGADAAPEIALSILAELVSTVRGGGAGSLKDRPGPIHPELPPGEAYCPEG